MALPVQDFQLTMVGKPKLGEEKPSELLAEVQFNISSFKGQIRHEWDSIKSHDILFLVSCKPTVLIGDKPDPNIPFVQQYGVTYVRGCEVQELLDEDGKPIREIELEQSAKSGNLRTVR